MMNKHLKIKQPASITTIKQLQAEFDNILVLYKLGMDRKAARREYWNVCDLVSKKLYNSHKFHKLVRQQSTEFRTIIML